MSTTFPTDTGPPRPEIVEALLAELLALAPHERVLVLRKLCEECSLKCKECGWPIE